LTAESLISDALVPLSPTDTGEEALGVMNEFYIRHLPVVQNGELLAVISEDDVLNADPLAAVGDYQRPIRPPSVFSDDHLYDVMRILTEYKLTIVPVIDREGNYLGLITSEDLLRQFGESSTFASQGSIIVLEVLIHDYSLSEISRIVESEGAIILSSFVRSFDGSNRLEVTIKVNSERIAATLATFERYNYKIKASFNEKQMTDALRERFDSLMNYLDV
jgi:CBS domain-containing protein